MCSQPLSGSASRGICLATRDYVAWREAWCVLTTLPPDGAHSSRRARIARYFKIEDEWPEAVHLKLLAK